MKEVVQRFLFWIVLGVVMLVIGGTYLFMVRPITAEMAKQTKALNTQKRELEKLNKEASLANQKWHEEANKYVLAMKLQEDKCYDYLKGYGHFWDKPFAESRSFDADVFRSIYETQRTEFAKRALQLIPFRSNPFNWPELKDNAAEDDALNIQRFYWIQEALLDTLVTGKARELVALKIPKTVRSGEDPEPYQSLNFSISVKLVYRELPDFTRALLKPGPRFLCFVDSLSLSKDVKALPTLKPGKPLEEPLVGVSLTGRMYLFHKPEEKKEESEEKGEGGKET